MSHNHTNGEVECDAVRRAQESPEARRKRLNKERMRRNRSNPEYRQQEQRRQRERRRERLMASKISKKLAKTPPQRKPVFEVFNIPTGSLWAQQGHLPQDLETPATQDAGCVVAFPTAGGFSVLQQAVAVPMLPPLPSNVSWLVVADSMQSQGTSVPAASLMQPFSDIGAVSPVHLGRNLNLDKSGGFWYSNEPMNQSGYGEGPVIKRES